MTPSSLAHAARPGYKGSQVLWLDGRPSRRPSICPVRLVQRRVSRLEQWRGRHTVQQTSARLPGRSGRRGAEAPADPVNLRYALEPAAEIAAAEIATAEIVATEIAGVVPRLLARLALAKADVVAYGAEKLLGNNATDESCRQAGEDRTAHATHHAAHTRSPARAAEGALHRPRLAHLSPRRQPRQALRVVTAPGYRGPLPLWRHRRQLVQRLLPLGRRQLRERLF